MIPNDIVIHHLKFLNLLFSLSVMRFAVGSKILMKNPWDMTYFKVYFSFYYFTYEQITYCLI